MMRAVFKKNISGGLISLLLFSGCVSHRSGSGPGLQSRALSEEERIGQQIHAEILNQFRVYTDPSAVSYVNEIGQNLAHYTKRKNLSYQFTILYSPQIYATSAPGGGVYLTTGMIYFLQNESELAAVLAHELGELQDQDPRVSRSRKVLDSVLKGSAVITPALGPIGVLALLGVAMAKTTVDHRTPTLEMRMFRADERAFKMMLAAGYDPQGLIDLQYRFLNAKPEIRPYFSDYYESRPVTQERMDLIAASFNKLPLQNRSFVTNRESFLEKTKGIRQMDILAIVN